MASLGRGSLIDWLSLLIGKADFSRQSTLIGTLEDGKRFFFLVVLADDLGLNKELENEQKPEAGIDKSALCSPYPRGKCHHTQSGVH